MEFLSQPIKIFMFRKRNFSFETLRTIFKARTALLDTRLYLESRGMQNWYSHTPTIDNRQSSLMNPSMNTQNYTKNYKSNGEESVTTRNQENV